MRAVGSMMSKEASMGSIVKAIMNRTANSKVEECFLYDLEGYEADLMFYARSDNDSFIDVPDDYFNALALCVCPVDIHTHPGYNCLPSPDDIARYLTIPELSEAYILGKDEYTHIIFNLDRESVSVKEVEKAYVAIANQVDKGDQIPEVLLDTFRDYLSYKIYRMEV